jgi:D-glycero-D-manno-heptose 1,7-bisphosphate phosphatase
MREPSGAASRAGRAVVRALAPIAASARDEVGGAPLSRRAVFLDRDGVLNAVVLEDGVPRAPSGVAALEILPGVADALRLLQAHGFLRIVVTNQPDVARGRVARDAVEAIHRHLLAALPLDAILVCYHDDVDACACRKPRPGLLRDAAGAYDVDLAGSFLVGDRWRDIEAGHAAGCTTFLVRRSYSGPCHPAHQVRDLPEAAHRIVELAGRDATEG